MLERTARVNLELTDFRDLVWLFFENEAKLKIASEIFPPLHTMLKNYHFVSNVISSWWEGGHFAQSFPMSEIELKNVLSIMAMQFTSTHCIYNTV